MARKVNPNAKAKKPTKAAGEPPVGKVPLGNLPTEKGQGAVGHRENKAAYQVGDGVFWATASTAGEWTFIGHPRGDKAGKVLVVASSPEIGFDIEADQCSPAGWHDGDRGRFYRLRYFRNNPRGQGNP